MADEANLENAAQQEEEAKQDFEALYKQAIKESRKWEERAKANKEKADKWDAAANGSDSLEERLAALEAENTAMKEAKARRELVAKVATATGLTADLVDSLSGTDEETLTAQAKAFAALKPKGAPRAPEGGKFPRERQAQADEKAAQKKFIKQLFGEE